MKYLSVIFLCGLLSSGNLQIASNEKFKVPLTADSSFPIVEEQVHPIEAYQTFQDNFYGLPERNVNAKPCIQNEHPIFPIVLPTNFQQVSPNRRSFFKTTAYKPSPLSPHNTQPQVIQEDNSQFKMVNDMTIENKLQRPSVDNIDDYIDDIKKNTDRLANSVPVNAVPPILSDNLQCANKTRISSVNVSPRRYLIPDNNAVESQGSVKENNFEQPSYHLNGNNEISNENTKDNLIKFLTSENTLSRRQSLDNQNINNLNDPTKGQGISDIKKTGLMLMDYDRICYACSSANNPACVSPDRRTTVKYCRKGVSACLTKTYRTGSTLTLIRDCGNSCDESEILGLGLKYKSCSICHTDLCNGAYSNNVHSLFTICALVLITLVKIPNLI